MAVDGSLKFDTKIDTSDFDKSISTLDEALSRLTKAVDNLSIKMDRAFTHSGASASSAAKNVDELTEAAKEARKEVERLEKDKASIFSGTVENHTEPEPSRFDDGNYDIYGNDVDAIIAKYQELEAATKSTTGEIKTELVSLKDAMRLALDVFQRFPSNVISLFGQTEKAIVAQKQRLKATAQGTLETISNRIETDKKEMVSLRDAVRLAIDSFRHFPKNIIALFKQAGNAMSKAKDKAWTLQNAVDRYQDALYYAERRGLSFGDKEYDKIYKKLIRAKEAAEKYKKSLLKTDQGQKKVDKSAKRMGASLDKSGKSARKTGSAMSMLGRSIMFSMVFRAISMIGNAAKEGFQNLTRYSEETNKSASLLMSANTKLKNSFATAFAPILQVAAPALKQIIDLLSLGATYAGQFIAALTGKSTFVKAVDVEEDYAASLKETNDELKEKEKETKKLAFAFDDLIQAQGGRDKTADDIYKPPTPDQMFETVEIEADIQKFADTVSDILSGLFEPMQQSWDENGSEVISAAKYALSQLKKLGMDVGETFMTVWEKEGYGKAVTDDLLISAANLLYTVGNLAQGFDEAWMSGNTGLLIMRHLGDLLLEVTGFFRNATGEIRIWSATLDFSPLLVSLDGVLINLRPIVSATGDILLWLLSEVLLPLAKWGLENGLPSVFNLIAAALKVLAEILDALRPLALWLWEQFLQPLGEWTGELIIAALQKLVEWLTKFSDWISQNQTVVESITVAVLAFFAAWKITEFVTGIVKLISGLGGFIKIGEQVIGTLLRTAQSISPLTLAISSIISLIAVLALNWDAMTPKERVITGVLALASAAGILAVALGALTGPAGAATVAIAIAAGVFAATTAINAGRRAASSGYSGGGYNSRSRYPVSAYALPSRGIPRLATGTVVPPRAGEFAAILGDNNRDTEIVSPVPAMKQAFKEAIEEMGGLGGNQTLRAELIVDGTKFGQLVYKFNNKEKQRVGVRMVTEG